MFLSIKPDQNTSPTEYSQPARAARSFVGGIDRAHEGVYSQFTAVVVDSQTIQQDTHKIDYIKGRVAFDLEWNSKDQTFNRDLFAFRTFFDYDKISVGIIVTRSEDLNSLFRELGITQKYGASTTHLGKLLPRLKAGRGGGCPLLIFGITRRLLQEEE